MITKYKFALGVFAGVALGSAAMHGLHAQPKPKAYTVTEIQTLDATALGPLVPAIVAAQKAAGGRPFRTGGGKIVAIVGAAPPSGGVAISEWDSLEQAQAFWNSKAWKDLTVQGEKAFKTIRQYVVEERS